MHFVIYPGGIMGPLKYIAFLLLMSSCCAGSESEETTSKHEQQPGDEPHFYVNRPFFDLEFLLESSDELREQFAALSDEDRLQLIAAFDEFNDDIIKAFHAMIDFE